MPAYPNIYLNMRMCTLASGHDLRVPLPPRYTHHGLACPRRVMLMQEVLEVAPAPGRVVLMDQDISHSVSAPHEAAGSRPRYSLVLKLVLHPQSGDSPPPDIALAEWGTPRLVGSARRGGGDDDPTRVYI